jgi:hypothetical protein
MVMAPRLDPKAANGPPADASLALRIEGELGQMRKALSNLIEFSGVSRREVERRLLPRAQDLADELQDFMREATGIPMPADRHRPPPSESLRSRGGLAPNRVG